MVGDVIVSFDVFTATRIEQLAEYSSESPSAGDGFHYSLGTTRFSEPSRQLRADLLRSRINQYLDLVATVSREVLDAPDSFVRLFLTLSPGDETIDAVAVKRLADANATIWIDA